MAKYFYNRINRHTQTDPSDETDGTLGIVEIGFRGERYFELEAATALLPLINKLTTRLYKDIDLERQQLDRLLPCDPRSHQISSTIAPRIARWKSELERLGCKVFSLDHIGFFNGEGFYLVNPTKSTIRYEVALGAPLSAKVALSQYPSQSQILG